VKTSKFPEELIDSSIEALSKKIEKKIGNSKQQIQSLANIDGMDPIVQTQSGATAS
jgi:hypothetical protein